MHILLNRSDFNNLKVGGFPDFEYLCLGIPSIGYKPEPPHICQLDKAHIIGQFVCCWEEKKDMTNSSIAHAVYNITWIVPLNQKGIIPGSHLISILAVLVLLSRSHCFDNSGRIVYNKILRSCIQVIENFNTCLFFPLLQPAMVRLFVLNLS